MKVRAKFTSRMDGDNEIWIIQDKIYELADYGGNYYYFKSEWDDNHAVGKDSVNNFFEVINENKPRICEILGVEVGEKFNIKGIACNPCVINNYYVMDRQNDILDVKHLTRAINEPEIVEKVKEWNKGQKEIFKALKILGYNYITRDPDERLFIHEIEPKRLGVFSSDMECWDSNDAQVELCTDKVLYQPNLNFINSYDDEPFEIPEVE